ncbi:MAG: MotA/TolQ/ExbB proton channel family protein [Proteobacteria bacterium]|nr:MotA/TolQ/ExbB proton channel family protein [Pseudomonadota bacterium]
MSDLFADGEFWGSGGAIIVVIAAASLIAMAVFLYRLWVLQRERVVPRRLIIQVRDLVLRGETAEAITLCKMDDSPLARVFIAGLRQAGKPREVVKEFLGEVGRHEGMALQRGLVVLETVAVVAPLLGLLGTVWGMIDVFQAIETHGVGDAAALAGGIGTALYTTLAGLLVAIPVRVGHSMVMAKVDQLVLGMEEEALDLLDLLVNLGEGPEPGSESLRAVP